MSIETMQSIFGLLITIGGLFYVLAKFKAEFDLHKKLLSDLILKVEAINTEQIFLKGYLFGKQN